MNSSASHSRVTCLCGLNIATLFPCLLHFSKKQILHTAQLTVCLLFLLFVSACSDGDDSGGGTQHERLEQGIDALKTFDFETAYSKLSALHLELTPADEDWAWTTYTLGVAAWHRPPPSETGIAEATNLFEALIESKPNTELAASALLDLGRIAEVVNYRGDVPDVPAAQGYYREVIEAYPDTEMSIRASLRLAQTYAQTFDPESVEEAVDLLEACLVQDPNSDWTGVIAQYIAWLEAFYLGEPEASLESYEIVRDYGFSRKAESDGYLWQYGLLAQSVGRDLLAVDIYTEIVEGYTRSVYGTVARQRIIKIAQAHPEANIEIPELSGIGLGR